MKELEKKLDKLLKIFKKRTKVLACTILDKDGFVIASLKEDEFMEDNLYYRNLIALYASFESIAQNSSGLIDFNNNRELISVEVVNDFFNNGFTIFIKSVRDTIVFITIFPKIINLKTISTEFEKVMDELSIYFLDFNKLETIKKLYEI